MSNINIIDTIKKEAGNLEPKIYVVVDEEGISRGLHLTWKTAEAQLLDVVESMCKRYIDVMANNDPELIKLMYEDMVLDEGLYDYEAAIEVLYFDSKGYCRAYNVNDFGKIQLETNKTYSYRDLESTQALINEMMHIELRRHSAI